MNNGPEWTDDDLATGEGDARSAAPAGYPERDLERDLVLALRPPKAPEGFADRTLARALAETSLSGSTRSGTRSKLLRWPEPTRWLSGAIAAALLIGLFAGGTTLERRHAEDRRAAAATAQFETAERITDQAMAQAREQIERAGVHLND